MSWIANRHDFLCISLEESAPRFDRLVVYCQVFGHPARGARSGSISLRSTEPANGSRPSGSRDGLDSMPWPVFHNRRKDLARIRSECVGDSQKFENIDPTLPTLICRHKRLRLAEALREFLLSDVRPFTDVGQMPADKLVILWTNPHRSRSRPQWPVRSVNREIQYRKSR